MNLKDEKAFFNKRRMAGMTVPEYKEKRLTLRARIKRDFRCSCRRQVDTTDWIFFWACLVGGLVLAGTQL